MTHILIVHANAKTCGRLSSVLKNEPSVTIAGVVGDARQALALLASSPCDVLVVDHGLSDPSAPQFLRDVHETYRTVKVLVTGVPDHEETILNYLEEGAAGYLSSQATWADWVKGIDAVQAGEFMISPELAAAVMKRIAELKHELVEFSGADPTHVSEIDVELTPREQEVLALISQGKSNREIAETLTIEIGTVKNHVHNLLGKLDVSTRAHAARVTKRSLLGQNGAIPHPPSPLPQL